MPGSCRDTHFLAEPWDWLRFRPWPITALLYISICSCIRSCLLGSSNPEV
jgi:hypothetical protein